MSGPPAPARAVAPLFTPGYRGYALGLLTVVYTFNFVDRQIITILQEQIRAEFALEDWQLGLLTGLAFALFYTVLGVPIARLADRGARRATIISVALLVWSAMTALCGLAANYWQLLAARIGVGVGEAGCTPPAHSMISDFYPARARGRAMGVYAMGIPLGGLIGMVLGGYIAEAHGWRAALLVAGLPGVALAGLVYLTLKEPPRGWADQAEGAPRPAPAPQPPLSTVLRTLMAKPTFVHLAIGTGLCAFVGYGVGAWLPPYFQRAFGLGEAQTGLVFGLMGGITGLIGTFLGGWLGDRYGAARPEAFVLIPAAALLVSLPLHVLGLWQSSWMWALALLVVPSLLNNLWLAPAFAVTQALAPMPMKAMASALLLLIMNLIGLGLGPMVLGWVSDVARGMAGGDRAAGLRWALILAGLVYLWAVAHLWLAARTLRRDVAGG